MPNGGSDCCMTCWFNRKNHGEREWQKHRRDPDNRAPDECTIRNEKIEDAAYTYCANHPLRRPERDPVPIGPITVHAGFDGPFRDRGRRRWKASPDTPEIRDHLLDLLKGIVEKGARLPCPSPHVALDALETVVLRQLAEFRESRAVPMLEKLARGDVGGEVYRETVEEARRALEAIRG